MVNPYSCYILGFLVSFSVYQLGWSGAYPKLSFSLITFLIATFVAHSLLSRNWIKAGRNKKPHDEIKPVINPWLVTAVLYICWLGDFFYEGGVPLLKVLLHIEYDYKKFGVPAFHVFAVTFGSFYCVYLFHLFLASRKREHLLLFAINMFASVLIYSRSMLFFNLSSCFFLYLLTLKEFPYKKLSLGLPVLVLLFYFFGVIGTQRVSFESNTTYNNNIFMDVGLATPQFRESAIPKEFFWSYFYISSPLANLQVNINTYSVQPITIKRILEYINNELLFESISKRVNNLFGIERENEKTIKDPFNVSTVYSRGYSYLGWIGIIITAFVVLAIPYYYNSLINNQYKMVGLAILCTTYLFLTYDNTIRLMALGFQLVYPVIFPWLDRKIGFLEANTTK
ncbi:hypothetical protein WSM22_18740 [Cytophagales bacterium WSM2-2]|nr:hypothetical protein WSM22_18740 [Cytophagales bacterium WSM2-2]